VTVSLLGCEPVYSQSTASLAAHASQHRRSCGNGGCAAGADARRRTREALQPWASLAPGQQRGGTLPDSGQAQPRRARAARSTDGTHLVKPVIQAWLGARESDDGGARPRAAVGAAPPKNLCAQWGWRRVTFVKYFSLLCAQSLPMVSISETPRCYATHRALLMLCMVRLSPCPCPHPRTVLLMSVNHARYLLASEPANMTHATTG